MRRARMWLSQFLIQWIGNCCHFTGYFLTPSGCSLTTLHAITMRYVHRSSQSISLETGVSWEDLMQWHLRLNRGEQATYQTWYVSRRAARINLVRIFCLHGLLTAPGVRAVVSYGTPQAPDGRQRRQWAAELREAVGELRSTR